MIFANKQDIEGAMTPSEVANALGLTSITTHKYQIFKTSAIKGTGLEEAMEWWVLLPHSFFPTDYYWKSSIGPQLYLKCCILFDCLILVLSFCKSHTRLKNLLCKGSKHSLEKCLM